MPESSNEKPGDELRDLAAQLVAVNYGPAKTEKRVSGKKVDVYFERKEFGRTRRLYLEAKDWDHPLKRSEVVQIWADYSGIVENNQPAELLVVTRNGLSSDADTFLNEEQRHTRHQTIQDLERDTLGLTNYVRALSRLSADEGIDQYYVGSFADYSGAEDRQPPYDSTDLNVLVDSWLRADSPSPIAVLGGYGAGKTTFAKVLISRLASLAMAEETNRVPIYIRLGMFARHTTMESMVANMFSVENNIAGFSVQTFLDCNRRGRFVIICDGFDEMKHAMSWADFRSTMSEINKLVCSESRLILLGRPSAFLSEEEQHHILRGEKKYAGDYQKLSNWPRFSEYTLRGFDFDQRRRFITQYLSYLAATGEVETGDIPPEEFVKTRAEQVLGLAEREGEIFSKPVHAQILTELASSPTFDIQHFGGKTFSRWGLYEAFFQRLCERENEKPARKQIPEAMRLSFLRELAYWLWTEQDGQTSFALDSIPERVFQGLLDSDASDFETKAREYLTGSFLERKHGEIYFFGHRSFAEFLVADRLLRVTPRTVDHPQYSSCLAGSVRDFFLEGLGDKSLTDWGRTLGDWFGQLDMDYVRFIAKRSGGLRNLRKSMQSGTFQNVLNCFDDVVSYGNVFELRLTKLISRGQQSAINLILQFIDLSMSCRKLQPGTLDRDVLEKLALALWHSPAGFQKALRHDTARGFYVINGKLLREIVNAAATTVVVDTTAKTVGPGWPDVFEVRAGQRSNLLGWRFRD